jgi:opacity protein-like surface antigen
MFLSVSSGAPNHALMKHLLLALLLVSFASSSVLADSPDAILKDYRKQATQAMERLNQSLEKTATPMITKLVSSGDTAGAEELTAQLKAKVAGEPVDKPQASAMQLFSLYDEARAKALAPVQKSSIARIDSLLKTAGGPKLETLTELGKVREEIEEGKVSIAAGPLTKPDFRNYFKQYKISKSWGYYLNADFTNKNGMLYLKEDGTLQLDSSNSCSGRWMPTSDPMVLAVELKTEKADSEKTQITIKGREATINRPSGLRYLRPEK